MKVTFLVIGKTDQKYLQEGIKIFEKRLGHYLPYEMKIIPDIKNNRKLSESQQKEKEGELILQQVQNSDTVVLMDERGENFDSIGFSKYLEKKMVMGTRNLIFVIGGPYGFSDKVYDRANGKISLSRMTFSHQMVRLIFVEQLYRAMTILKNEPYHHQ
ncbi:23S rRNA (pseudouridine(1915)-N(3))-methyltransferase RlmH [Halosquirtibacter xylanolyticus]|uniref:23S rRNA (pseudouridine(1915)-N(3))-methyltransferase RlmH n=1 Tax=Halosquirtibacter xylanolyticus TaxID=3374599 RepID=UPI003747B0E2|nr:23S rRNA (pseudouridine(1915)-N(3))-methyltransferase RlmH [Prolixibacteraceae bacterium]